MSGNQGRFSTVLNTFLTNFTLTKNVKLPLPTAAEFFSYWVVGCKHPVVKPINVLISSEIRCHFLVYQLKNDFKHILVNIWVRLPVLRNRLQKILYTNILSYRPKWESFILECVLCLLIFSNEIGSSTENILN